MVAVNEIIDGIERVANLLFLDPEAVAEALGCSKRMVKSNSMVGEVYELFGGSDFPFEDAELRWYPDSGTAKLSLGLPASPAVPVRDVADRWKGVPCRPEHSCVLDGERLMTHLIKTELGDLRFAYDPDSELSAVRAVSMDRSPDQRPKPPQGPATEQPGLDPHRIRSDKEFARSIEETIAECRRRLELLAEGRLDAADPPDDDSPSRPTKVGYFLECLVDLQDRLQSDRLPRSGRVWGPGRVIVDGWPDEDPLGDVICRIGSYYKHGAQGRADPGPRQRPPLEVERAIVRDLLPLDAAPLGRPIWLSGTTGYRLDGPDSWEAWSLLGDSEPDTDRESEAQSTAIVTIGRALEAPCSDTFLYETPDPFTYGDLTLPGLYIAANGPPETVYALLGFGHPGDRQAGLEGVCRSTLVAALVSHGRLELGGRAELGIEDPGSGRKAAVRFIGSVVPDDLKLLIDACEELASRFEQVLDEEPWTFLKPALERDPDKLLKLGILKYLLTVPPPSDKSPSKTPLGKAVGILLSQPSPRFADAVVEILFGAGRLDLLLESARSRRQPELQIRLLQVLIDWGVAGVGPALEAALGTADEVELQRLMGALCWADSVAARTAFAQRLDQISAKLLPGSPSELCRSVLSSAMKLGPGLTAQTPRFYVLLGHEDVTIRVETARALGEVGPPECIPMLERHTGFFDEGSLKAAAKAAIRRIRERPDAAVGGLSQASGDGDLSFEDEG